MVQTIQASSATTSIVSSLNSQVPAALLFGHLLKDAIPALQCLLNCMSGYCSRLFLTFQGLLCGPHHMSGHRGSARPPQSHREGTEGSGLSRTCSQPRPRSARTGGPSRRGWPPEASHLHQVCRVFCLFAYLFVRLLFTTSKNGKESASTEPQPEAWVASLSS